MITKVEGTVGEIYHFLDCDDFYQTFLPPGSLENNKQTILADLRRTRFYDAKNTYEEFTAECLTNEDFVRNYLQGDLEGNIPLLTRAALSNTYSERHNFTEEQTGEFFIENTKTSRLGLTFRNSLGQVSALSITFSTQNPSKWALQFTPDILTPIATRQTFLLFSQWMTPEKPVTTGSEPGEASVSLVHSIDDVDFHALLKEPYVESLIPTFLNSDNTVNYDTISKFNKTPQGKNLAGIVDSHFKREALHLKIRAVLSLADDDEITNHADNEIRLSEYLRNINDLTEEQEQEIEQLIASFQVPAPLLEDRMSALKIQVAREKQFDRKRAKIVQETDALIATLEQSCPKNQEYEDQLQQSFVSRNKHELFITSTVAILATCVAFGLLGPIGWALGAITVGCILVAIVLDIKAMFKERRLSQYPKAIRAKDDQIETIKSDSTNQLQELQQQLVCPQFSALTPYPDAQLDEGWEEAPEAFYDPIFTPQEEPASLFPDEHGVVTNFRL